MNYSLLEKMIEDQPLSRNKFAIKCGLSGHGLAQTISNQSMKVDVLEKISVELGVHPCLFFDDAPKAFLERQAQSQAVTKSEFEIYKQSQTEKLQTLFMAIMEVIRGLHPEADKAPVYQKAGDFFKEKP